MLKQQKGKYNVVLPDTISATVQDGKCNIRGPKGELVLVIPPHVVLNVDGKDLIITPKDTHTPKAFLGLTRSLVANMIEGVIQGFVKKLEIEGVGYRVALTGTTLVMQLGFSHPVELLCPPGILFQVEKNVITVSGIDKALVGQTAANIRALKKPEPYKGKGIHYMGEVIKRKEGKRAGTV